jgi:hypothetical protein
MDAIFASLGDVFRDLFLAFVAIQAYKMTRDFGEKVGRFAALTQAAAWIAGLAFFAAFMMGSASCEEAGDPMHGGCEQYADDSYEPTIEERASRFLYVLLLLGLPASFGLMDSRRLEANPWKRPDRPNPHKNTLSED